MLSIHELLIISTYDYKAALALRQTCKTLSSLINDTWLEKHFKIIGSDGSTYVFFDGKLLLHSWNDEPAMIIRDEIEDETRTWYAFNKIHRSKDLPAMIMFNDVIWWHYGKIHRDNGPAWIESSGICTWWYHDTADKEEMYDLDWKKYFPECSEGENKSSS